MRNSEFAKALAVALLVLLPAQGAFPQATNTPDASTPATPAAAPAPDSAAPATPPPSDQAPAVTPAPDQTAPAPDVSAAPGGKKNKKIVTSPDTTPAPSGQGGPIVREINIEYIGPKTVAQSVILSNMRTTVGEVYSAASV